MDNLLKIKIAFPFLFVIIGLLAVRFIDYKLVLNPSEMRIADFVQEEVLLQTKREHHVIAANIKSPIEMPSSPGNGFPPVPLNQFVPQQGKLEAGSPEFKVTMIVIGSKTRMAIVNGLVVREGSFVDRMVVKKIEKDRVLLAEHDVKSDKVSPIWFSLEEIKK